MDKDAELQRLRNFFNSIKGILDENDSLVDIVCEIEATIEDFEKVEA